MGENEKRKKRRKVGRKKKDRRSIKKEKKMTFINKHDRGTGRKEGTKKEE